MDLEPTGTSLIGVFTTDAELVVRVWDDAMRSMTGIESRAAVGRRLTDIIPDLDARGLLNRFELVRDHGTTEILAPALHKFLIPCEPRTPSRHFSEMRQAVNISALRDGETIRGLMVVVEDVTERMEREREIAARLNDGDDDVRLQAAQSISQGSAILSSADAEPVIGALRDKNWRVRRKLVDSLARRAAPDAVAALLTAFRDDHWDFGMLNSALQVLQATSVDTTDTLIGFLRSDDADLRMQAALALGHQNNASSVDHLTRALDDENPNVRYHAIEALGHLKAADAVAPILDIAESRDFFLSFAALDALKEIGDGSVVHRVTPLLSDELLSEAAVAVLVAVGDVDVVEPIVDLLNRRRLTPASAAAALSELFDRYEADGSSGEQILNRFRQTIRDEGTSVLLDAVSLSRGPHTPKVIRVAGWIESDSVREKLVTLIEVESLREAAVKALVRHGEQAVDYFVEKLASEEIEIRKSAAQALGELHSERGTAALIEAVHTDPAIAVTALQAIGRSGSMAAFDSLVDLLATPDKSVRRAAANTLKALSGPEMSSRLCGLVTSVDPNVREAAVRIIGSLRTPDCEAAVIACCEDADELVRIAALEQLPDVEAVEGVATLAAHALNDDAPRARAAAVQALGKFDNDESRSALRKTLSDPDSWTRYFAIRSLSELKDTPSVEAFRNMAARDDAEQVRMAAEEAIREVER